jgi:rod shape-determining protein MreD
VKPIIVLAALVVALLLQTTVAGLSLDAGSFVNVVLIAVVYIALSMGALTGLLAGAAGGLAQDAIAGSIVGIGGLAKTLVGFLVGVLGAQFIVSQPIPRFVMFVGATFLHELCFQGLHALVEGQAFQFGYRSVLTQAALNAVIGILAFQLVESAPGVMQRREARSSVFGRRKF